MSMMRCMKRFLATVAFVLLATRAAAQAAVVTRNVNLREGPSTTSAIKQKLEPPDELTLLDSTQTNGYYEVRVAGGEQGWVWARNVRITGGGGPPAMFHGCPPEGLAVQEYRKESNRKKNRITRPQAADIDAGATIDSVLHTGDDRTRWSDTRGASIVAYVVDVKIGSQETVNCGDTDSAYIDTHIDVVQAPTDTRKIVRMIVEVTPRWRSFMGQQGADWTTRTLKQTLLGHWVRFTGWLFWDFEHADASEHTNTGASGNWRATAWEIHPITQIKLCPGSPQNCD